MQTLLLAHLLADFPLQTGWIHRRKMAGGAGVMPHVLIHVMVTAVLIQDPGGSWPLLAAIGIAHFAIDCKMARRMKDVPVRGFIADQLVHGLILAALSLLAPTVQVWLTGTLLETALLLAVVPAVMMFTWICASVLVTETTDNLRTLGHLQTLSRMAGVVSASVIASGLLLRIFS